MEFKKCHSRVKDEIEEGPSKYRDRSLRQLALEEIRSFKDIFGVSLTEGTLTVKKNIIDSDVHLFIERVCNIWNSNPPLIEKLPRPVDLQFRALYFGVPDMFRTVNLVARYCLYCDQILAVDPFGCFRDLGSSLRQSINREPQALVRKIVRDGVYLCSLEGWIESGLVELTAFPLRIDDPVRLQHVETMKAKQERMPKDRWDAIMEATTDIWLSQFTPEELDSMRPPFSEDWESLQKSIENPKALALIKQRMPDMTEDKILRNFQDADKWKKQVEHAREELKKEPRRYSWAQYRQFENQFSIVGAGMNLEDANWLAGITGAHLVTDRRELWNEIIAESQEDDRISPAITRALTTLGEAFQQLKFKFLNDVPLSFALKIRQEGRLAGFRSLIRDFWNKVRTKGGSEKERLDAIMEFQDKLAGEYEVYKREFAEIEKSVYSKVAFAGLSGAGALITGNLQLGLLSAGFLATAYSKELQRQTKTGNPLSVFLDLDRM